MNSAVLKGNIAGDIYNNQNNEHPFLRLLLFSSYPQPIIKLRIALLDGRAKGFYTSLRKGSEIEVIGHLVTRRHENNFVPEVEVRNLVLLRNFSWTAIEAQGTILEQGSGKAFVIGTIGSDIFFEWRKRHIGKFLGENDQYAFLQFNLSNKTYPEGLNIVVYGFLAQLVYPYLRPTSEVAMDGLLRQDKQGRWAVVAENAALLRNIDYARAEAAQSRLMQMGEINELEDFD